MANIEPMTMSTSKRAPWETPRLAELGDVCSLTETGSMASTEGDCFFTTNDVGNTCMG